jgi:alpha-beta hydrolase superfamily lysophospholipase
MKRSVVRRSESRFEGADGASLFRRSWLPPLAEHVLVVVHGFAEHSGRYDELGAWFASRGCAVHALDHRGHGRSAGPRAHVDAFSHFVDDLERFVELVAQEHPGFAPSVLGHSMGGLVVTAFLERGAPGAARAITSAAALSLADDMSRARVIAAKVLRRLLPRLRLASGIDPWGLSRDPDVVQRYLDDPLVFRKMTTALAAELLGAIERVGSGIGDVHLPLLVMHGGDDPICPAAGSRALFARARHPRSRLQLYPKLRHEILNEPEREDVYQDVLDWLREATV